MNVHPDLLWDLAQTRQAELIHEAAAHNRAVEVSEAGPGPIGHRLLRAGRHRRLRAA